MVQWLLPIFICAFLYKKLFKNTAFSFSDFQFQLHQLSIKWYLLLLLASAINWRLETYKWQLLIHKFNPLGLKKALASVFSGVAVSQLLPYKTGEYLGRLVYISDRNKWNAGLLSVVGSYSQLLITLLFGIIGFAWLKPIDYATHFIVSLCILISVALIFYWYLPQYHFTKKYLITAKLKTAISLTNRGQLLKILGLSALRYLSFLLPYSLLAWHLGLSGDASFGFHLCAVSCIFFMQTIAPNFILTDIALRLTIPLVVFTLNGKIATQGNEYLPGMLIYLFNVAFPMLIGTIIIVFAKLKNQ